MQMLLQPLLHLQVTAILNNGNNFSTRLSSDRNFSAFHKIEVLYLKWRKQTIFDIFFRDVLYMYC